MKPKDTAATNGLVKIDKNIPAPPPSHSKYPWDAMELGDSFFTTASQSRNEQPHRTARVETWMEIHHATGHGERRQGLPRLAHGITMNRLVHRRERQKSQPPRRAPDAGIPPPCRVPSTALWTPNARVRGD